MKVLGNNVHIVTHIHAAHERSLTESLIDLSNLIEIQMNSTESRGYVQSWEVIASECAAFAEKVKYLRGANY